MHFVGILNESEYNFYCKKFFVTRGSSIQLQIAVIILVLKRSVSGMSLSLVEDTLVFFAGEEASCFQAPLR